MKTPDPDATTFRLRPTPDLTIEQVRAIIGGLVDQGLIEHAYTEADGTEHYRLTQAGAEAGSVLADASFGFGRRGEQ
jgi:hypothetical protein